MLKNQYAIKLGKDYRAKSSSHVPLSITTPHCYGKLRVVGSFVSAGCELVPVCIVTRSLRSDYSWDRYRGEAKSLCNTSIVKIKSVVIYYYHLPSTSKRFKHQIS